MKSNMKLYERGQSIVLVALLFLAFIAVLALVLDGGMVYAARRQAQNAADAGALAGATWMCTNSDLVGVEEDAEDVARVYAMKNNAANLPEADANLSNRSVVVTATVDVEPFFATLIGFSDISPRAVAEAECQPPSGFGIMPVAWSCRKPATGAEPDPGEIDPDELGCSMNFGKCQQKDPTKPGYDPYGLKCTYVFMDSVKVREKGKPCDPDETDPIDPDYCYTQNDIVCDDPGSEGIDPGTIDCDINGGDDGMGDGIIDLMTGGARSWLDLNGPAGGANELMDWLEHGFNGRIRPFTWLPQAGGTEASVFKSASFLVGKDVKLPAFDKICSGEPNIKTDDEYSLEACTWNQYKPVKDDLTKVGTQTNFHIVAFSLFHVTCLQTGKNPNQHVTSDPELGLGNNDPCPGHAAAVGALSIDDNDKTIEGYFMEGEFLYGYGSDAGNGVYVGTFTVVLVR